MTLAFVDFSNSSSAVIRTARQYAAALRMKLILMHISTPDADAEGGTMRADISRRGVAGEMRRYHRELKIMAAECTKLGVDTRALLVRGRSIRGNPVPKMIREMQRVKPALVVMGTHRHSRFFEAMFGSTSTKIARKAACPILLVPSENRSGK